MSKTDGFESDFPDLITVFHGGAGCGRQKFVTLKEPSPAPQTTFPANRVVVRDGSRVHFLTIAEIDWIEADRNYLEIHCGSRTLIHRETMGAFLERLPSSMFVKVHRSVIVNLDRIKELRAIERGEYEIVLENGQAVETTLGLRELKEMIEA